MEVEHRISVRASMQRISNSNATDDDQESDCRDKTGAVKGRNQTRLRSQVRVMERMGIEDN